MPGALAYLFIRAARETKEARVAYRAYTINVALCAILEVFGNMANEKRGYGGDFKRGSAEMLSGVLSEERIKRARDYVRGEEFKAERERIRKGAAQRIKGLRDRYKTKNRPPEEAARERELQLRLAGIGNETAELRLRLSELLEEEEEIKARLRDL